jgi:hypothetical protein
LTSIRSIAEDRAMPTMSRSQRALPIAAIALAILLCTSGTAAAALPSFKGKRITSNSIGGVRIGMSLAQVKAVWGPGGISDEVDEPCGSAPQPDVPGTCTWRATSRTKAWVDFGQNGRVEGIGIAGKRRSAPGRLRAPEGLGLGTRGEKLFARSFTSYPAGFVGPVPGPTMLYLGSGRLKNISFWVNRSGSTAAVTVG